MRPSASTSASRSYAQSSTAGRCAGPSSPVRPSAKPSVFQEIAQLSRIHLDRLPDLPLDQLLAPPLPDFPLDHQLAPTLPESSRHFARPPVLKTKRSINTYASPASIYLLINASPTRTDASPTRASTTWATRQSHPHHLWLPCNLLAILACHRRSDIEKKRVTQLNPGPRLTHIRRARIRGSQTAYLHCTTSVH